jgi:hypothetical protein
MKDAKLISRNMTIVCFCGKTFNGRNEHLLNKLLGMHCKLVHDEIYSTKQLNIIQGGTVDIKTSKNNPKSIQNNITAAKLLNYNYE